MSFFSVLNSWTLILTTAGPALLQDCQRLDPEHCCSTLVIPEAEREELSVPQDRDPSLYRLRDANKGSHLREQPWAITHTAVFFAVTQSQARETTSESAFKAQSSNSPPNNILSVDVFKAGFLILIERLTCRDRMVRGFGGSSGSLTPAQLSACILHNHAWATWDKVSGMERSPRRVFYPLQHLCSSVSQGTGKDNSFKGLKVLRNTVDSRMNT